MIGYTAIYGAYDELTPHPEHPQVERWVCFTDNPTIPANGWEVVHEPARFGHPRLAAKWRKCHPPEGDTSLWIDGSMRLRGVGLIDAMIEGLETADWVMWRHPDRTSIRNEARVSEMMVKYRGLPVVQQADHYCNEWGWPDHQLWASTTIARRHTQTVMQAGAAWFAENERWTYQDQLSLPPVLARYGIKPASLAHSLWANPWFAFGAHASDL